jgi:hypothetical protein
LRDSDHLGASTPEAGAIHPIYLSSPSPALAKSATYAGQKVVEEMRYDYARVSSEEQSLDLTVLTKGQRAT